MQQSADIFSMARLHCDKIIFPIYSIVASFNYFQTLSLVDLIWFQNIIRKIETFVDVDSKGPEGNNSQIDFLTADWISIFPLRREVDGFFKILDKNSDGKLSFEEFLGEETHIEKIFRTMDKDNDGFVSKEVNMIECHWTTSCLLAYSRYIFTSMALA